MLLYACFQVLYFNFQNFYLPMHSDNSMRNSDEADAREHCRLATAVQ